MRYESSHFRHCLLGSISGSRLARFWSFQATTRSCCARAFYTNDPKSQSRVGLPLGQIIWGHSESLDRPPWPTTFILEPRTCGLRVMWCKCVSRSSSDAPRMFCWYSIAFEIFLAQWSAKIRPAVLAVMVDQTQFRQQCFEFGGLANCVCWSIGSP